MFLVSDESKLSWKTLPQRISQLHSVSRATTNLDLALVIEKKKNNKKKYKGLYSNRNISISIIFINICDRELLRQNIFKRTSDMLESGLIDEVQNLKQKYNLTLENQSMKAIGYKQVLSYFDNNAELANTFTGGF